jgi:hypothetical protein
MFAQGACMDAKPNSSLSSPRKLVRVENHYATDHGISLRTLLHPEQQHLQMLNPSAGCPLCQGVLSEPCTPIEVPADEVWRPRITTAVKRDGDDENTSPEQLRNHAQEQVMNKQRSLAHMRPLPLTRVAR